ncbi:transporter substrate-binding protein [Thalassoglobus sp. JC818]|uniref:transporter substrate-binding protein n=1 Tax=Thalassoglobus sp. JC818 TaxID=3232136 RepID=UPI003459873C
MLPEESDSPSDKSLKPESGIHEETFISGGLTSSGPNEAFSPQSPEDWIGRKLGHYEIRQLVGRGGMGIVYLAHDVSIDRDVAIKMLPNELANDPVLLQRFQAEARSAGKLQHHHVVSIYEVGEDQSANFLVMELVSGGSASERLSKQGPLPISDATLAIIQACQGISAAHRLGLVHRDIKPANLLFNEQGEIKISDFGLAKSLKHETLQMTRDGQVVGTPYYMSPEQCESRPVDARSDVYSLGATYYSLLTAKSPYEESTSIVQVMYSHCHAPPPDPRVVRATVPVACAEIINKAMAIDPEDRYQSVDEMRVDLEAVLAAISGHGIQLPSQSGSYSKLPALNSQKSSRSFGLPMALAAGLLLLLAGFAFFANRNQDRPPGNESIGAGNPADPDTAAITPPQGEPIRIGLLHSLSGTMSQSESPVADAALLAIEELNQNGGVLGRPVEAVVADGRSDWDVFAREAKRLIHDEEVVTVFGCWTSASRKTIVPIFEESNHLLVYPLQYEGVEESPNVIYMGAAPNQQILPAIKWAYAFDNRRRFFFVGSDYVFPRVAYEIAKDQLEELGTELVGTRFLPLGSHRVDEVVAEIVAAKADVILNCINGSTNTDFFQALRKAGVTPANCPTISFSIGEQELRQLNVDEMVGDYAAWNYFQSINSPVNEEFVSRFHKKYGPQHVITDPMEAEYAGIKLWAKAVEQAESTDPPAIRKAFLNQKLEAPEGPIRIDPATQHCFKTPRIGQIRPNGQFDIIWTDAKPVAPAPYPPSRSTQDWRAVLHDLYSGWGNQWSAPSGD